MANGFFLGGVAQGLESAERASIAKGDLSLREKALAQNDAQFQQNFGLNEKKLSLAQRAQGFSEKLQSEAATRADFDRGLKIADAAAEENIKWGEALAAAGKTPEEIASLTRVNHQAGLRVLESLGDPSLLERYNSNREAMLAGLQTPQQEAEVQAEADVAKQKAVASSLGLEGQQQQDFVARQFVTAGNVGEFRGLVNELARLEQAGQIGSTQYKAITNRVNKLSSSDDTIETVTIDPNNGNVTRTVGPASAVQKQATADQLNDVRAVIDELNTSQEIVTELIRFIESEPSAAGAMGNLRRAAEVGSGLAKDVAGSGANVFGIDLGKITTELGSIVSFEKQRGGLDDKTAEEFTPQSTARADVASARLKYGYARALQPTGKLLESTIKSAGEATDLTGLTSSDKVIERLQTIGQIIEIANKQAKIRAEQMVQGSSDAVRPTFGQTNSQVGETVKIGGATIRQIAGPSGAP